MLSIFVDGRGAAQTILGDTSYKCSQGKEIAACVVGILFYADSYIKFWDSAIFGSLEIVSPIYAPVCVHY